MSVDAERPVVAIRPRWAPEPSSRLARALALAEVAHRGQRRTDGRPYVGHPVEVAGVLAACGADEDTLVAALLHDVVEDSDTPLAAIEVDFGPAVAALIEALTESPEIDDWVRRKNELRAAVARAGRRAATIYAADKLTNVRELAGVYSVRGEAAIDLHKAPSLDRRVEAWWRDLEMAGRLEVASELTDELRTELERFEAKRAAASSR